MIGPSMQSLLTAASPSLASPETLASDNGLVNGGLVELLRERNGFYAFEAALHVFGSGNAVAGGSLEDWNASTSWRAAFQGLADGFVFFAEDILGSQFALRDGNVYTFDPETGVAEFMAGSLEGWAGELLSDYELLTGFPLAHAWQQENGPIRTGHRLVPKRPFVLGGDYAPSNLYSADAADGMRVRGELAVQIKDLPDGAQIRYRIVES